MIVVTQLAMVVICAALAALAILGWVFISILKKAPKKQMILTLISAWFFGSRIALASGGASDD